MSCSYGGCGGNLTRYQPEYNKQWKAQNNAGCSCSGSGRNSCSSPSLAKEGSPLWKWEQTHGKLVTKITTQYDEDGRAIVVIEKVTCPPVVKSTNRNGCCSFGYRINR